MADTLDVILAGLHDPKDMPFAMPWTDAPREELIVNALRYYWTARAGAPPSWAVLFAVRLDGELVGQQELAADHFAVTRTVGTGSWVARARQGRGIGTEMRAAVLQFAFDHLGAERANSGAYLDNPTSLRVSEKLGYRADGTNVVQRRPGERAVEQRLTLDHAGFRRPDWTVRVSGLDPCRAFFGL